MKTPSELLKRLKKLYDTPALNPTAKKAQAVAKALSLMDKISYHYE
jgi:hypothetical protein